MRPVFSAVGQRRFVEQARMAGADEHLVGLADRQETLAEAGRGSG